MQPAESFVLAQKKTCFLFRSYTTRLQCIILSKNVKVLGHQVALQQSSTEESGNSNDTGEDVDAHVTLGHQSRRSSGAGGGGRTRRLGSTRAAGRGGSRGIDTGRSGAGGGSTLGRIVTTAGLLGAGARQTWGFAGTVLHVLGGGGWYGREFLAAETTVAEFEGVAAGGAGAGRSVGLVAAVSGWGHIGRELALEGGEIGVGRDFVAANIDKAVSVVLLGVLIDQTTAVHSGHLVVVKSRDLLKFALVGDASILGKAFHKGQLR